VKLHPVQGHVRARGLLASALSRGGLPGPLLLHGAPGVGKQRLALWAAQLAVCEAPGPEGPCDTCRQCHLSARLEHPDVHWYFPLARPKGVSGDRLRGALEDARAQALAEWRNQPLRSLQDDEPKGLYLAAVQTLRRKAVQRPAMAHRQVFVISRAEELVPQEASPEAANAILKLLEEPPSHTWFILTSGEPGRLLPTIRSRTLPLHVPALTASEVSDFLVARAGADPDEAERAALLSQGAIGRALGFLGDEGEPGPLERTRRDAFRLLRAGLSDRRGAAFGPALGFGVSRARALTGLFSALEGWLRDLGAAAAGVPDAIVNIDARDTLESAVREGAIHPAQPARALEALDHARILAAGNVNPQLIVAGLLRDLQRHLARTGPAH
jgi:DNA polymerase-3 subunit delta'